MQYGKPNLNEGKPWSESLPPVSLSITHKSLIV